MKYLTIGPTDEEWGLVTTTIGKQHIGPQSNYPIQEHPSDYLFKAQTERVHYEYQLVYSIPGEDTSSRQA